MNVRIEKLVFGGQGLGKTSDGKIAFVWNALPGEEVELDIIKNKKTHIEANASRILTPSSHRVAPREDHFLSCSPWQILSFDEENQWKIDIAKETYAKIGGFSLPELDIVTDEEKQYSYRNKIEYSFAESTPPKPHPAPLLRGEGTIKFSFFERGRRFHTPIEPCLLADPHINETAEKILSWINERHIPLRSLKSLIIRSNRAGQTIAGLFIKDPLEFSDYPVLTDSFLGFHLYYSTHKSPASVPTKLLFSNGAKELTEEINGKRLSYGLFGFFQINVPIFGHALQDIAKHLEATSPLLDFYSGVGAIGIPLADACAKATLVESNADAIFYAKENVRASNLDNFTVEGVPAEQATNLITNNDILIVDPPRAGLHERLVKKILEVKPPRVIYLSCNLATHAKDIQLLSQQYKISFLRLYNFFPRTPHIETLCVLEKK